LKSTRNEQIELEKYIEETELKLLGLPGKHKTPMQIIEERQLIE
jgi:hypothetical protein